MPPVVLVLQPLQSGTHSHLAFTTLPLPIPFVAFLKLTASSRPSAHPSDSPKCLRFGHWLTLCTLDIHLFTYLLIKINLWAKNKYSNCTGKLVTQAQNKFLLLAGRPPKYELKCREINNSTRRRPTCMSSWPIFRTFCAHKILALFAIIFLHIWHFVIRDKTVDIKLRFIKLHTL